VTPLVVASYNIHRGVGLDRRYDLDRIAKVIAEIEPDLIGLQEVVRGTDCRPPTRRATSPRSWA
jgi:endonuclease/exonuclease/phosphatase family metal-dependent hydrolase